MPIFQVHFDHEFQGEYTLAELVEYNQEGAPELCEWMQRAQVGDTKIEGGGASPVVITERVA